MSEQVDVEKVLRKEDFSDLCDYLENCWLPLLKKCKEDRDFVRELYGRIHGFVDALKLVKEKKK